MEVWLGFAGGMASELLDWFRIRKELHLGVPGWAKSWLYWAITVAMAGVGGLLVFMYRTSGIEVSPMLTDGVRTRPEFNYLPHRWSSARSMRAMYTQAAADARCQAIWGWTTCAQGLPAPTHAMPA